MGKLGSSARPSRPLSQKLCTLVRRSAKIVGVVSERLSKTLIKPLFSATKTRPSLENLTVVGWVRPLITVDSVKPEGSVDAASAATGGSKAKRIAAKATAAAKAANTPKDREVSLRLSSDDIGPLQLQPDESSVHILV